MAKSQKIPQNFVVQYFKKFVKNKFIYEDAASIKVIKLRAHMHAYGDMDNTKMLSL